MPETETTDADGDDAPPPDRDAEELIAELEAAIAAQIEANARLFRAADACLEAGVPSSPALFENLARSAREGTETCKRLTALPEFEADVDPAAVDGWETIPTNYDRDTRDTTTTDDPFR